MKFSDLLADIVSHISPADIPAALGSIAEVQAILQARLLTPRPSGQPDRLLPADEVAERLSMTKDAVYRQARKWPFTRRPAPNTLRFSERGLDEWLANPDRL